MAGSRPLVESLSTGQGSSVTIGMIVLLDYYVQSSVSLSPLVGLQEFLFSALLLLLVLLVAYT